MADEFSLMMPFVVVESNGGPYDDAAFVAGYQCGTVDAKLAAAKAVGANHLVEVCYSDLRAQIDLIAMRHGYTVDVVDEDDEWSTYSFLMDVEQIEGE